MKKLIGIVVALALVLAMLPVAVFAADNYYVAGVAALCGDEWKENSANNIMIANGDVYTKTYTNVAVGTYEFKVTDGTWNNCWGDGGNNYKFAVTTAGDITITFNPNTKEIKVSGSGVGEAKMEISFVAAVGAGAGGFLNDVNWDPANASNKMTEENGVYTITYTDVAAGTYEYKFAANGAWTDNWGYNGETPSGETVDAVYNSGSNAKVVVAEDGSTVELKLDTTAMDSKGNGAKITATVTAPAPAPAEPVTYYMANGVTQTITIPAGGSANVVVDARGADMILTVNGGRMFMEWWLQAGRFPTYPDRGGVAEAQLPMGDIYTVVINNSSTEMDQILDVTAAPDAPAFGTWDNPAELIIGYNEINTGRDGYFINWVAPEAGELTVSVLTAVSSDWVFACNVFGETSSSYGDNHFCDAEPLVDTEVLSVAAGDQVQIIVGSLSGEDTFVVLEAAFVPGETGGEEGGEGGEGGEDVGGDTEGVVVESGTDVAVNSGYVAGRENNYETLYIPFTPDADGILTVHMISGNPGWKYKFYFADGSSTIGTKGTGENFESFDVLAGNTYGVEISGYFDWEDVDATVSYELIFKASEIDQEEQKEEWVISDITLEIGDNDLTMEQNAENTLFEFTAPEAGTYTFTAPEGILIGNWNSTGFPLDMTFDKTNVLVWECTSAGQPVVIGVAGSESIILNVQKTADGEELEQKEYEDYIVKHVPLEENMVDVTGVQVNNIDITKPQTLVKDEKGFFHLGSIDGPIVYFNLSNEGLDLLLAHFSGYGALAMRGDYTDADGNVHHYEFKDATFHYANVVNNAAINNDEDYDNDNSLYPLTTDLMMYLQCYGAAQGWYDSNLTPYEAIRGEHNADSAWLVSCVYLGEEIVDEPETPEDPEVTPGTGDYSIAGLVVAMMAATAGAIVIGKKKEF